MIPVLDAISTSNNVLVISHIRPDGDAIGSLIGMGILLSQLGKKVTLFNESGIPDLYRFIPMTDQVITQVPEIEFDTAILLDCANIDRVGSQLDRIQKIPTLINIDHHAVNSRYGTAWIDSTLSSTCELVYQLAQKMQLAITVDFAIAIYAGIMTDTSSFRNESTNLNSFLTTVSLLETGFSPSYVAEKIYGSHSVARLQLIRIMIEHMKLFEKDQVWFSVLPHTEIKDLGAREKDIIGLIEYGKGLKAVRLAALAEEMSPGSAFRYQISIRTRPGLNAAEFAKQFSGGGHPRAAGFSTNLSLREIQIQLIQFVQDSLKNS